MSEAKIFHEMCERCNHEWNEECYLDRGFPHTWMPKNPSTAHLCPRCNKNKILSWEERYPGESAPETVVDWWARSLDKILMKHASEVTLQSHPSSPTSTQ